MRHEIVKRHVGYFRKRLPRSIDRQDLYQAGMMALLRAEPRYDGRCGATLETFLSARVYGAIQDEIRSARPGGRRPYSERPVMLGIEDAAVVQSEDKPLYEYVMQSAKMQSLREAVSCLPPRMRAVIELHYQDGFLLREIGEVFGFNEARACQLVKEAVCLMRQAMSRWM